jgi:hypothetical protein
VGKGVDVLAFDEAVVVRVGKWYVQLLSPRMLGCGHSRERQRAVKEMMGRCLNLNHRCPIWIAASQKDFDKKSS